MTNILKELIQFPTLFTYKIISIADPLIINQVIKVVQDYIPGEYKPTVVNSKKKTFFLFLLLSILLILVKLKFCMKN